MLQNQFVRQVDGRGGIRQMWWHGYSLRMIGVLGISYLIGLVGCNATHAATPAWAQRMLAWPVLVHHALAPVNARQEAQKWLNSVLKNMAKSENGLLAENAGKPTQAAQRRVVLSLDELIKLAEQMSKGGGSGKKSQQQQQQSMGMQQVRGRDHNPTQTPSQSATQSYLPNGGSLPVQTGKPFESNKKQWGNLPPRARNMIINAMRNESLPQYKNLVNAYYRALGRMNERQ